MTDRARSLRREQSPPESVLWSRLRGRRLGGFKFRRQHPIGPFVVDFCCPEASLVVEVDSSYHDGRREADEARDKVLQGRGYVVFRVTASELAKNFDGVLETLLRVARERIVELEKKEERR